MVPSSLVRGREGSEGCMVPSSLIRGRGDQRAAWYQVVSFGGGGIRGLHGTKTMV